MVNITYKNRQPVVKEIKWLIILCFADAFFTDIGLVMNVIDEANPLIKWVYNQSIIIFYGVKMVLPAIFLVLVRLQPLSSIMQKGSSMLLILYVGINTYHIFWLSLTVYYYF